MDLMLSEEADATSKARLVWKKTYSGGTSASVGSTQADSPFEVMAVRDDPERNTMCASVVVSGRSGESGLKLAQPSKYMALLLMFRAALTLH